MHSTEQLRMLRFAVHLQHVCKIMLLSLSSLVCKICCAFAVHLAQNLLYIAVTCTMVYKICCTFAVHLAQNCCALLSRVQNLLYIWHNRPSSFGKGLQQRCFCLSLRFLVSLLFLLSLLFLFHVQLSLAQVPLVVLQPLVPLVVPLQQLLLHASQNHSAFPVAFCSEQNPPTPQS